MKTFFALNTTHKVVEHLPEFAYWEEVQNAFRWGIRLSCGIDANGIGRCHSPAELLSKANHSGYTMSYPCGCTERTLCTHGNSPLA